MFSLRSKQVKIAFCERLGLAVDRVKRLLLAILVLCFSALTTQAFAANQAPADAQPIVASTVSTTVLIDVCRRAGDQLRMDCAGYILGVYDQMSFSRLICPPDNPNGGTAQAVAVALKFLNDHPEQWHLAPFFLIGQSFKTAFPCGPRQN
jgi:hypothetical protein